jgi:hypothetical protein
MAVRVGSGAPVVSASNAQVTLEERSLLDGTLVRSIDVSALAGSPSFGISSTASSEGALTRSSNGAFVVLAGYQAALGTASIATSTAPRCIVRVDAAGSVSASTVVTDGFTLNNFRAATTVDGTAYWGAGAGMDAGIRYVVHNSTGSSTSAYFDLQNNRSVLAVGGQLFASTGSSTAGVIGVPPDGGSRIYGLGALPTSGATYQQLVGVDVQSPNSFSLLDLDPGVAGLDTLYTSDFSSAANGGVRKYVFNGTNWTQVWRSNVIDAGASILTGFCNHVAAERVGADVVIVCTVNDSAANRIVKYVDVGGTSTVAPVASVLTVAPANTVYRGVAFSPQ